MFSDTIDRAISIYPDIPICYILACCIGVPLENVLEAENLEIEPADHSVVKYKGRFGFKDKAEFISPNQMIFKGPYVDQDLSPDVKNVFNTYKVGRKVLVRPLYLIQVAGATWKEV